MAKTFRCFLFAAILLIPQLIYGQNFIEDYENFKKGAKEKYSSFREECNREYAEFLRSAWDWYEGKAPFPLPKDEKPVPPRPYEQREGEPVETSPVEVPVIEAEPQPKPIEPIRETPTPDTDYFTVDFYGIKPKVRLPETAQLKLTECTPDELADAWQALSTEEMNNAIRDCLETRIRYRLSDWAYLQFLDRLSRQYCSDRNGATLLMAFLFCQSGYQMRLAQDGRRLIMLFGSKHIIFEKGYYELDGSMFYVFGDEPGESARICSASFEGEEPLSLYISQAQNLGETSAPDRNITTDAIAMSATARVPKELISFYNDYPTSLLGDNVMTRWAMYAQTPLSPLTKAVLYPGLRKGIEGCSKKDAAEKLLYWVQMGLVYEYDDKVWGHDRAFFAEESLFYPYADCEDRSILYSRLIRDLLGLDVALIYYPGHLATAVKFDTEVEGDAMIIDGDRYIVCDPTYIGAPVGAQMPDLEYDKAQAIVLK